MNEENFSQSNESIQNSKHIWITIIAVVITAIIVGGGVYIWQKAILQSIEQSFSKQAIDLQGQIGNLQQTAPPVATTPETTQDPTQSTDETTNWKTYENKEIGFSFRYPASYGDFQITIDDGVLRGDTGKKFTGMFQNVNYYTLSGTTADHTAGRSGDFSFFVKYLYEDGKYYHQWAGSDGRVGKKLEVEPIKIMSVDNQKVLIVNDYSYVAERNQDGPVINPGPGGGALMNLPGEGEFKGVAFWRHDLSQNEFEDILKTFKFTK